GRLPLEHEREGRCRRDEVDELPEERLLAMLGVVLLGERAVDREQPRLADLEPAALEAGEDLAGELPLHGVGLDQYERALRGQGRRSLLGAAPLPPRPRGLEPLRPAELRRGRRFDRGLAVRAHLPQRLERRLAVDASLLELRRADRADEERSLDLRPADRTVEVTRGEALLHRADLELALA